MFRRTSFLYVAAVFLVGPAKILLSAADLLKMGVGAQPKEVQEYFELDG